MSSDIQYNYDESSGYPYLPLDLNLLLPVGSMHLKADCVTAARQDCPISKAPSNVAEKCSLLFPEGFIGWILHGPTYPKIHCALDFFRNCITQMKGKLKQISYLMTKLCKTFFYIKIKFGLFHLCNFIVKVK